VTPIPEEVARWLEGVYRVSVEPSRERAVGFDVYFERGGERFKLHTDFTDFRLYCDCKTSAKRVLEAVAELLRPAVEQSATGEWPKWEGNALVLPAGVGWAMFLRLWARYNMSLRVEEGGRELLRVEVLEARADGTAKFRLWYHKWHETRPHQPYVDVEIKPYHFKGGKIGFVDRVYVNKRKGIYKDHLAEVVKLLKSRGVEGVNYYEYEKKAYLQFTGAFRDSVLARLGIKPELPPSEPPAVEHLGGLRFRICDREVEFGPKAMGVRRELYAVMTFPSREEAERFAKSLGAIGVDAGIVGSEKDGYAVRLDSDAFFGLLAATDAVPPGLKPLYRSEGDDFREYASVEEGRIRFYFAVKHEGVWRAVDGLYSEWQVQLIRAERDVLEAIRSAVAKALGRPADVEEPKEYRDKKGDVVGYYLRLYGHHLKPFLEHAAETMKVEPAEVRLEGRRIVVEAGGVRAEVELKLLKRHKAEFLPVQDIEQMLALYKSLKEVGMRVEITPKGVKVDGEALWALVATALERSAPSKLPAEVVHSVGGLKMYIFRAEGVHYYFVVKTEQGWRAAGGKQSARKVEVAGEAAPVIADTINAVYNGMGVDRRVEVKYYKNDTPYIQLTNEDLRLLGLARREP